MANKPQKNKGGYDKSLYQTPIYRSWYNMKTRCQNPNATSYKLWGGRGIKVCKEWQTFAGFLKDMGDSYFQNASIDRIDNNGHYCKENCRWATKKEQANNTRKIERSIKYTFQGQTKRVSEWAKEFGIKRTTLDMRLRHYKMPIHVALTK